MGKRLIWTEHLINQFPVDKDAFWLQMFARVLFLFVFWFLGYVINFSYGLGLTYLLNFQLHSYYFGTGFIILLGTFMVPRNLPDILLSFKSILRLDESEFEELSSKIERYNTSFIPLTIICLIFILTISDVPKIIPNVLSNGIYLLAVWELFFTSFMYLLVATGVWLGISIWITIFLISKQPLSIELSTGLIMKFRGLSMLTLWFSFFYFLAISIGLAVNIIGSSPVQPVDLLFSPLMFFVLLGLILFLLPFYNIHRTLIGIKKNELLKIENDYQRLLTDFEDILKTIEKPETSSNMIEAMASFTYLQMKEKSVKASPVWPIDVSFITKLLSMILIPAIVRISVEIFNRFYLR